MEQQQKKSPASLSLDLDNLWSYLKIHGDQSWENYPSYYPEFVPLILDILEKQKIHATFFIVGEDAARKENSRWLKQIASKGHEFGNHSFYHEPWMEERSLKDIKEELLKTHQAIFDASGVYPVGFRGPGFCMSRNLLEAVSEIGYRFDASLFPTIIAPLARLYYLMTTKALKKGEEDKRKNLFGKMSNGLKPLKPFAWELSSGSLLEIPVTTIPLIRLPFHLSYVIWLSKFSKKGALIYFKSALGLCKTLKVEPSFLLHPLDFFGKEDFPELSFFPGMDLLKAHKLEVANLALETLKENFDVIPMSMHAGKILGRLKLPD